MKKHFNFKSVYRAALVALCLMTVGVGEMWGDCAYHVTGGYIYLDATAPNWTESYIYLGHGHDESFPITRFSENKISGTNLYWINNSVSSSWATNVCYLMFFEAGSAWPSAKNYDDVKAYAPHYSGKSYYSFDANSTYLVILGSTDDAMATISYHETGYSALNHAQTVKKYTCVNGTSFSAAEVNSGTVTISAYKMTGNGTASDDNNSATLDEASETSDEVDAAYTGEVTLTAEANEGYEFLGWYSSENGGSSDKLSSNTSYTYNAPNGTKTVYARFAPKFTTSKTYYLVTSAKWREESARFAAVFCNRNTQQWENCTVVDGTSNEIYSVDVPEGDWGFVIFCRMKNGSDEERVNKWDNRWCQTDDMFAYGTHNCVYITGDCSSSQRWGKYAPSLALVGTMNDWDPVANPFTDDELTLNDLAAHSGYNFKIANGKDDTWYGYGDTDNKLAYVGQTSALPLYSNQHNLLMLTAGTGDYTFTWNGSGSDPTLQVSYPTVTHPSVDYIYVKKFSDWDPVDVHLTGGTKNTVAGAGPALSSFEFTDEEDYYYAAMGDNTTVVFGDGPNGPLDGHKTADLTISGHQGQFYDASGEYKDWAWRTFQVSIGLNDMSADAKSVDPNFFWLQLNSTDVSTLAITTLPEKSHYDFHGFYTRYADGEVSGEQVIDDEGNWIASVPDYTDEDKKWIHSGTSTTLYAKWTRHPYTISLAVTPSTPVDATDSLAGGTVVVGGATPGTVTAYKDLASVEIRADSANYAYIFKEWRFSSGVTPDYDAGYTTSSNPIKIKAESNGTLTAVFQCRYGLVGSRYDDEAAGMPDWDYGSAADFAVLGFTSLGEGADKVDLECARTLGRATSYKFRIYDRIKKKAVGCGTKGAVLPAEYDPDHGVYNNWQLTYIDDGEDVNINTLGRGTYTFHITNMSDDDNYWPSVQVDRQTSYQVHIGWKHAEAENLSSLSTGNDGGTASVTVDEGDGSVSVSNNDWVAAGSTITINAVSASSYDFAGWWNGDAYTGVYVWGPGSPIVEWDVSATVNAFAKFTEKTNTFEGDETGHETEWNQTGNWSAGHIPTINEVAIIPKQVVVDITDAKAKRVLIKNDSPNNGQIEIPAGKELIVAQTIKQTTDGSTYGATGENDIIIGSTLANGNGALVMNEHDGTNKATVYFATKAKTVEQGGVKHNVNQFIGTPFNDENDILYDYYGTKIYEFRAGQDGTIGGNWWRRLAGTGEKMHGFLGYNILTNQTTEPVLEMTGTLCKAEEHSVNGYYGDASHKEYLFANSWVAPIYIPNFEDDDFTNMDKTIYIFNAGTPAQQAAAGEGSATATSPGQYIVLPINASPWAGMNVIPSMQAFSVFANDENPKLTFNYERLVYNPALATGEDHAGIVPNRAPRKTNNENAPTVLKLKATGESGYAANVLILNRADFSEGFDDGWDGRFLPGDDAAPQLYAVTSDGNMAINCSPDVEGTLLGFKAGEADNLFTITFEYDDEALYLFDTHTQAYTRVLTGNTYTFVTTDEDAHNRFILTHNAPSIATGVESITDDRSAVTNKMIIDHHLFIFRGGVLYDATGRMVK